MSELIKIIAILVILISAHKEAVSPWIRADMIILIPITLVNRWNLFLISENLWSIFPQIKMFQSDRILQFLRARLPHQVALLSDMEIKIWIEDQYQNLWFFHHLFILGVKLLILVGLRLVVIQDWNWNFVIHLLMRYARQLKFVLSARRSIYLLLYVTLFFLQLPRSVDDTSCHLIYTCQKLNTSSFIHSPLIYQVMVYISDTALPFVVIHNEIKLRPKSFVKVSVRFVPISGNAKDMMQSVLAENVTHWFFTSEQSCRLLGMGGRYSMINSTFSTFYIHFIFFLVFVNWFLRTKGI